MATSTAELARYCAKLVRQTYDRLNPNDGYHSWENPFEHAYLQYRLVNTRGEYVGTNSIVHYPDAERLLATLANEGDDMCRMLVGRMQSGSKIIRARRSFALFLEDGHRQTNKIRDGQRKRVYRAEDKLRNEPLASAQEAESFVYSITESGWWVARSGFGAERPRVTHSNRSTASARSHERSIKLAGRWSWSPLVLVHELAHLLAPVDEHHGPVFTALHILLTREFVDASLADQLRESYLSGGAKIATDDTVRMLFNRRLQSGYRAATLATLQAADLLRVEHQPIKRRVAR